MTTATITAPQAVSTVDHEPVFNDAAKYNATFCAWDVTHQGDLIFVGLHSLPTRRKPHPTQQLADGDTQGSRHILRDGIAVYDCDTAQTMAAIKKATGTDVGSQYIGPVFVSPENPTEDDVAHPEHGNQGFPAGCVVAVVYQRNLDAEEIEQRTRD